MSLFSKTLSVPYHPDQAFELVSDIARYPDFIKWITAMRVREFQQDGLQIRCIGDAAVGFKGFSERFSTAVVADAYLQTVTASLISGPFSKLHAQWRIAPLTEGGCDVRLEIDYAFKNMLIDMLASANHSLAVDKVLDAFLTEAKRRYGGPIVSGENG